MRVKLHNFVTYDDAEFRPGPHLNMIIGPNGTGKSTLLNLITSALQPVEGTVSRHVGLKLAKYSQHSADQLPYDKSPIEHLQSLYAEKYPDKDIQAWRAQLGRFGLSGAHQTSPIKQLSDGLRNRCVGGLAFTFSVSRGEVHDS